MSATSFYWLRQLRRVRRSFDSESAARPTLVHAGATKSVTDTLQRVMNAAARVVRDTRKFDHGLTQILRDDLHWLDVADRVTYKLGVIMHRCWHGKAPQYLVDCCTPVTDVVGRQRLRSASQQLMVVPRHRLSTVGRRAFAVHGPKVWNSLPDDLRAQQDYESLRHAGPENLAFLQRVQRIRPRDFRDNSAI